jgi:DnaJ-like protein
LQIPNCNPKIAKRMSEFDSDKDYYEIIGANERTSQRDLDRLYKRMAARRHPDRGGSEDEMKSLNEAYRVLKDEETRREYDAQRSKPAEVNASSPEGQPRWGAGFVPVSSPPAQDVGLLGHGLSAFFCLLLGLFLLFLVRVQWMRFLWPLGVLAVFVIILGVMMARSAMRAFNASLPPSNPFRRHSRLQEAAFWTVALGGGYGVYLLLTAI